MRYLLERKKKKKKYLYNDVPTDIEQILNQIPKTFLSVR